MRLCNTISNIVHILTGKHTDTLTKEYAHIIHKRKAHTLPVIYESHEPLVKCFDTSSDATKIDNEELQTYDNLSDDMNIHNIQGDCSLILYDELYIEYRDKLIYTERARKILYTIQIL